MSWPPSCSEPMRRFRRFASLSLLSPLSSRGSSLYARKATISASRRWAVKRSENSGRTAIIRHESPPNPEQSPQTVLQVRQLASFARPNDSSDGPLRRSNRIPAGSPKIRGPSGAAAPSGRDQSGSEVLGSPSSSPRHDVQRATATGTSSCTGGGTGAVAASCSSDRRGVATSWICGMRPCVAAKRIICPVE